MRSALSARSGTRRGQHDHLGLETLRGLRQGHVDLLPYQNHVLEGRQVGRGVGLNGARNAQLARLRGERDP